MNQDYAKLDALLNGFIDRKTIPGCSCVLMRDDEVVFEGHYGYSNIEKGTRINAHSMFRQGEGSNLFTYIALAMLYEEGRFLFSDPIGEYLPEWKNLTKFVMAPNGRWDVVPLARPLTIRTAVATMCGLPPIGNAQKEGIHPTQAEMNRRMEQLCADGHTPTLREQVRAMGGVPVMFEPYSHWHNGFGVQIIGAIIEELTGKPLRQVFKERIIDPLGLTHTDTYITDKNANDVVTAYLKQPDGVFVPDAAADCRYDASLTPVGACPFILSSAKDCAILTQMLANGGTYKGVKLLGSGTVAMLINNQLEGPHYPDFLTDQPYVEGYAYGMGLRTVVRMKYGHNGHFDNFGTSGELGSFVEADQHAHLAISYAHNMTPNEEIYHHHRVRAVAYGCAL